METREDSVLMNMTDYNFTVWVVWGSLSGWKRWWWWWWWCCAGLGGGGGRRRGRWRWRSGGGSRQAEWRWPRRRREKTSKCCQSKKDGGWKGPRGVKSRSWLLTFRRWQCLAASFHPDNRFRDHRADRSTYHFLSPRDREWNNRGSIRLTLRRLFESLFFLNKSLRVV